MREKILAILAITVVAIGAYTLFFRSRSSAPMISDGMRYHEMVGMATTEVSRTARSGRQRGKTPAPTAPTPRDVPQEAASAITEEMVQWGSDPFVRDWVLSSEVANLNLRAITVTATGASALINDQILQVGDEISGKKVVEIKDDQVTLEQGGRRFTLTLGE